MFGIGAKSLLIISLVLALLVVPAGFNFACTPKPTPALPPAPPPTSVPAPATFQINKLFITPTKAKPGEKVIIAAEVSNAGGTEGSYSVTLTIDGVEAETKAVRLSPGTTEMVTFSLVEDKVGTYSIKLDGLTGTLIVEPSLASVYINPQTYRVTRILTIKNETAGVNVLRLWMPAVVDWDSQRDVVTEKTTPPASSVWKDPQSGTGILFWEFRNEPSAGSSLKITDQFTFTCYEVKCDIDPGQIGVYDKTDPQYALYTCPEKYLEADDPNITKTAKEIMGSETNPYAVSHSIYGWVIDHMRYQDIKGLGGAKFACEKGYGNCGDYSALFVALCRAAGIPARPVVGRWATSVEGDWHVWAEFYLPKYGWIPVDSSYADITGRHEAYFGHLDNKRLIFHKQYNITLHPSPYFIPSEWAHLQTWVWEYQGFPGKIDATINYSIKPASGY